MLKSEVIPRDLDIFRLREARLDVYLGERFKQTCDAGGINVWEFSTRNDIR